MVDVIAVLAIGGLPVSRLVLQNVEVLAVAQDPARRPDGERKARVSSSVTLAVTPEEAEKLVLATERGKIRLALRSQGETSLVRTQGYSPESLGGPRSGGAAAAAPARLRPAPPPPRPVRKPRARPAPVEIIKGNKVERIEP